jgi:tetratricopeptide (TPR) repeat protein
MAILKDLTTTTFKEKSVVYLHGQHHGLWLLNTADEMAKVKELIPPILNKISNERPWVFIGYSGEDPVFEHIKNLARRFDNGLYWVTYKDNNPSKAVCDSLFNQPNTNAFLIKGYDADSFMLKLNSELDLPQPTIVDKPFSTLGKLLDNIVDINEQEHFKGVKERLVIAKKQVSQAVQQFEQGKVESTETIQENSEISLLKKKIIDLLIKDEYQTDEISQLAIKAKAIDDIEINSLLADLYYNWGTDLGDLAKTKTGEEAEALYQQAFDKYQQAIAIKPDKHEAFNNWVTYLGNLAQTKTDEEAEALYQQAFDKYQQAIAIKPDDHEAFYNWGTYLGNLAQTKTGEEAEALYQQAFDKYQQAIAIKPDDHEAFNNWGTYLGNLAQTKTGEEAEALYQQAFEKYKTTYDLGGSSYNLACAYALKADKENALFYLDNSLKKKEISTDFVLDDGDWKSYLKDEDFNKIINLYAAF